MRYFSNLIFRRRRVLTNVDDVESPLVAGGVDGRAGDGDGDDAADQGREGEEKTALFAARNIRGS